MFQLLEPGGLITLCRAIQAGPDVRQSNDQSVMLLWNGVNGKSELLLQIHIKANSLATGKFNNIYKSFTFLIFKVGFSDLCCIFESIVRF